MNQSALELTRHDTTRHDTNFVHLFWTGGWDSTYRLVELSRMNVTVQPVYCLDKGRPSIEIEKSAMNKILQALRDKSETKANILPIKYIELDSLPENQEITEAYNKICESVRLGSQYEWLAKAALIYPGIELGIEKPIVVLGGCTSALRYFTKMIKVNGMLRIDPVSSSPEGRLLFENIVFPILDINELEMLKNIRQWGYEDVMSNIWFCFTPIDGQPCGTCYPCILKIDRGMGWLLPTEAHKRYKSFKQKLKRHERIEAAKRIPVIGSCVSVMQKIYRLGRTCFIK